MSSFPLSTSGLNTVNADDVSATNLTVKNINASNVAIQSLSDSAGTNGTTNQVLAVSSSGLSVWKSPIVSTVFYVDGANGNDANLGSQTFPFKTIQNALNKCTSNTIYYTVYVNPYNNATGYPENLTITNSRLNLIGVQSNANTKSVAVKTITLNNTATNGATLDIICIQNLLIQGDSSTFNISLNYGAGKYYGGFSLYLLNCEVNLPSSNPQSACIAFAPFNQLSTRYYINNCRFVNQEISTDNPLIYIAFGELWSFNGNSLTNKSTSTSVALPLLNIEGKIVGGITNCTFETTQDICLSLLTANGGDAFSIGNNLFKFKTLDTLTTTACLVLGNQNVNTAIGIINNSFINNATTQTLAQEPFIRLNGATAISQNNNFNIQFAPSNSTQATIYPVGNYGSNTLQNAYGYYGSVYTNKSATIFPVPFYPLTTTVASGLQVSDMQSLTTLKQLTSASKTNVVGYDTGTGQLTYQPNNKITGLTSATQSNVVGYDTGTGQLTYQPAGGSSTPTYIWYKSYGTSSPSATIFQANSSIFSTPSSQAIFANITSFLNYSGSTLTSSNWTPVWGSTLSTRCFLYFPSTGVYSINWSFGFKSSIIYIATINKNWSVSNWSASIPPNDSSMIACLSLSPQATFNNSLSATITIETAGTSGDYITLTVYNFSTGTEPGLQDNNFRNPLIITKLS